MPPPPPPEPSMPTSFIVCIVMWIIHGLILDVLVIGVLPFLSVAASDAQRADKFPWALGGYKGFPRVPNLHPTHRRFIAENAAYALLRIAPALFITNIPVMLMCVASYFIEGLTIAWEIVSYNAPAGSMVPATLMGIFATTVTYTYTTNTDDFVKDVDPMHITYMQATCALTWACWLASAITTATK